MFLLLSEFFLQFFHQEGAPLLLLLLLAHWLKIATRNCPSSTPFIQVFVDAVTKVVRVKLCGLVCGKSFLTKVLFAVALRVFLASHECANKLISQQDGKVRWLRKDASGFCSHLTTFGFLYNAQRRQVKFPLPRQPNVFLSNDVKLLWRSCRRWRWRQHYLRM